ncbi:hypothetical protein B0T10DRAFT_475936 [Thelonectria olida]|uniref:Uncharacterized protein n=1 Tax=Thelonectria olida TaxID=1576542 RepID=A0A9P8WEX3_9HYPO|nr:hypothetical protein B0T10DRAFT_475936 [Thelonectria olida]
MGVEWVSNGMLPGIRSSTGSLVESRRLFCFCPAGSCLSYALMPASLPMHASPLDTPFLGALVLGLSFFSLLRCRTAHNTDFSSLLGTYLATPSLFPSCVISRVFQLSSSSSSFSSS